MRVAGALMETLRTTAAVHNFHQNARNELALLQGHSSKSFFRDATPTRTIYIPGGFNPASRHTGVVT